VLGLRTQKKQVSNPHPFGVATRDDAANLAAMADTPHSAAYFGDSRDFWWNRDFLELMSRRWQLATVGRALDVGCGQGHWSSCLAPFLPAGSELVGLDREPRWIAEAEKRRQHSHLRQRFLVGTAERLPFPDGSFDFVTCQTVLIHVRDPRTVLGEMLRVLKPGGLLAVAEPNNVSVNLVPTDLDLPATATVALIEFQMRCERGKMKLGEGFNSVGPFLPGWLAERGCEHIDSYQSDKTSMLVPPYSSTEAQALLRQAVDFDRQQFWIWNREDTLRYFLADGGAAGAFEPLWRQALAREHALLTGFQQNRLSLTTAPSLLLVSARTRV
jgi:SAM-dependent methyltransferase